MIRAEPLETAHSMWGFPIKGGGDPNVVPQIVGPLL